MLRNLTTALKSLPKHGSDHGPLDREFADEERGQEEGREDERRVRGRERGGAILLKNSIPFLTI